MGVWEFAPTGLKSPEIAVLDVGGGSSVVVRSSDGRSALVDAGTFGSLDVARWTVLPYLIESRCRSLDYVILSHAHADHISGLPELVSNFRVKRVLLGESFELSRAGARVERFLIDSGIPFDYVAAGDNVSLGDVTIQIMHPPRDRKLLNQWDENGRSSAVRGVTPRGTFILFADVTGTGLQYLSQHADLSADVVLAAHHGGQSGMETTSWRWPLVLFSARTGFVRPERLESYRKAGSRVLTTCDNGTIVVRFAERIEVETFGGRKPATGGEK
jgi:competence protein ComEC